MVNVEVLVGEINCVKLSVVKGKYLIFVMMLLMMGLGVLFDIVVIGSIGF